MEHGSNFFALEPVSVQIFDFATTRHVSVWYFVLLAVR